MASSGDSKNGSVAGGKEGAAEAGEVTSSGRMVIREEVTDERPCIFRFITAITRTWGFLTLFGRSPD